MHRVDGSDLKDMGKCKVCELGKSTRNSRKVISYEERGATKPLERVCSGLVGRMKHRSIGRSRYFSRFWTCIAATDSAIRSIQERGG